MNERKHLFLDLEDTIIESIEDQNWHRTRPINIECTKRFIEHFEPDEVHIYSYAIWNERERNGFNRGTRPMLETLLGVKFNMVLRVDEDIIPESVAMRCPGMMGVEFIEMSNYWGKQETFKYNVRALFGRAWEIDLQRTKVVLLDDSVWNENFQYPDLKIEGQIIKVENQQNENNS